MRRYLSDSDESATLEPMRRDPRRAVRKPRREDAKRKTLRAHRSSRRASAARES